MLASRVPCTTSRDCNSCLPTQQGPNLDQELHRDHLQPLHQEERNNQGQEIIWFILELRQAPACLPLVQTATRSNPYSSRGDIWAIVNHAEGSLLDSRRHPPRGPGSTLCSGL